MPRKQAVQQCCCAALSMLWQWNETVRASQAHTDLYCLTTVVHTLLHVMQAEDD